ncbi:hypothetical protein NMG60_11027415 [Bertholletia excelsa]
MKNSEARFPPLLFFVFGSLYSVLSLHPVLHAVVSGACGYFDYRRTINEANVTRISNLFRNGVGCGACYQVKCKIPALCTINGVVVVVIDYGQGDRIDFVLSNHSYTRLACPGAAPKLISYGTIDMAYKSVPCKYPGRNLMVKIHEYAKFPDYLAITFLYVGGENDITQIQVWKPESYQWMDMRRSYGAVLRDLPNPPTGALTIMFFVSGSAGNTWMKLNRVIPCRWRAKAVYDTGIQLF